MGKFFQALRQNLLLTICQLILFLMSSIVFTADIVTSFVTSFGLQAHFENDAAKLATFNSYASFIVFLGIILLNLVCVVKWYNLLCKIDIYERILDPSGEDPEDQMNALLQYIADTHFKFNHAHRVSIYKFDEADGKFYRVGRFCKDPELNQGGGREAYFDGVIAAAWRNHDIAFQVEDLPDPNVSLDTYEQALNDNDIGLSRTRLQGIRMKSRSYYCLRTEDVNTSKSNALILFESFLPNRAFSMKKIKKVLSYEEGKVLANKITIRGLPSDARRGGF
jgi:hypothetical protein